MTNAHTCHATNCKVRVPPAMFMCKGHWKRLPRSIQRAIWDAYVPGQEDHKDPSDEYIKVAHQAIEWIERHGGSNA